MCVCVWLQSVFLTIRCCSLNICRPKRKCDHCVRPNSTWRASDIRLKIFCWQTVTFEAECLTCSEDFTYFLDFDRCQEFLNYYSYSYFHSLLPDPFIICFPPPGPLSNMDSLSHESFSRRLMRAAWIYTAEALLWEDPACFHRSVVPNVSPAAVDRRMCSAWEDQTRLRHLLQLELSHHDIIYMNKSYSSSLFFLFFHFPEISMRWLFWNLLFPLLSFSLSDVRPRRS